MKILNYYWFYNWCFKIKKVIFLNVKNKYLEVKCIVRKRKRVNIGMCIVYVICMNIYYVVIRGWLKYWIKLYCYKIIYGYYLFVSS